MKSGITIPEDDPKATEQVFIRRSRGVNVGSLGLFLIMSIIFCYTVLILTNNEYGGKASLKENKKKLEAQENQNSSDSILYSHESDPNSV